MTDTQQRIEQLEEKWFDLMQERMEDLERKAAHLPFHRKLSVLEAHNKDPHWEKQFDCLEAALRLLDKAHPLLAENQAEHPIIF